MVQLPDLRRLRLLSCCEKGPKLNSPEGIWRKASLPTDATIQQAIKNLDQVAIKIVLVVNAAGELEGTISDGDIRRGLLKGLDLSSPITDVIYRNPLVVPPELGREMVMQLMVTNKIQQIPAVDEHHHVVGLHLWEEITTPPVRPNLMVIMAGGMGTRLRPQTENCPKPLLPVAGKPILEHIIERAKLAGFSHFVLAIHYLGKMIMEHFEDGSRWQVQIEYLQEQSPLGTAGALGLLRTRPEEPFLVTNGDVLTDIRYDDLLDFHSRHSASATMAVRLHEWQHPFGVVNTQGVDIVGFEEKPVSRSHINAGIYVLEPHVLDLIGKEEHWDMPMLFARLREKPARTIVYPMHEPWLDVGQPDDYDQASISDLGSPVTAKR